MEQPRAQRGMRTFLIVWWGQLISLIGSGLTSFALGVWVFNRTGSTTQFALILLFNILPSVLIAPLAGAIVDRWPRRTMLLITDTVAGLSSAALALLLLIGQLQPWHIYLGTAVSALGNTFRWPALAATITLLVPKRQLGRANGMLQLGQAGAQILAPALAGLLVRRIGVEGVVGMDVASFLVAVVTLLCVRLPEPERHTATPDQTRTLLHEMGQGWAYLWARPGLLSLLLFFAAINFNIGIVQVLITPLVLSFASTETLGTIMSVAGAGMLIGGISMSVWGGPRRRIRGVLAPALIQGLALLIGGLRPNALLIAGAACIFLGCSAVIMSCSQTIWQSKVPPELQGRVFGVRSAIGLSALPLAYLIVGPLADRVFEPLLQPGGPLVATVGSLLGVGPGRGIGLLLSITGLLTIGYVAIAVSYPQLRHVEDLLPDTIPDVPPEQPATGTEHPAAARHQVSSR